MRKLFLWQSIQMSVSCRELSLTWKGRQKRFLLCMCLHMCVNNDSFCITLYNTATSRDGFQPQVCVCACVSVSTSCLCAYRLWRSETILHSETKQVPKEVTGRLNGDKQSLNKRTWIEVLSTLSGWAEAWLRQTGRNNPTRQETPAWWHLMSDLTSITVQFR